MKVQDAIMKSLIERIKMCNDMIIEKTKEKNECQYLLDRLKKE